MTEPYAGPKDGDYVAYLEELERVQWAQMAAIAAKGGVTLPDLGDSRGDAQRRGKRDVQRGESKALNAAQARAVRETLAAGRGNSSLSRRVRGALLPIAIGFALAIFGLIAEGGLILVLIGAAIAFSGVRALFKALSAAAQTARAAAQLQQAGFPSTQATNRQR